MAEQLLTATGGDPRESATETTQLKSLKDFGNGETSEPSLSGIMSFSALQGAR